MTQLNRFHMEMSCFWKPITSRCLASARKWRTPLLPTLAVVKHQKWPFAWGLRSFSESFVIFQEYIIHINTELFMIASRLCSKSRTLWQNLITRYKMITQNDFSFFLPIITDIVSKILPPSFYWQCFQTPATQLSSVISTSSSRGVQQRDTLIYVTCTNFSTTMTLVIWKLLSIWKSAFWMSF